MTETERLTDNGAYDRLLQAAYNIHAQSPDWVHFYREVLGVDGIVRRQFPTQEAMAEFERSEAYATIHQMLTRLREQSAAAAAVQEPTCVITVRLPKSLHDTLREEAHEYRTSMNKLCISKLLQFIETQLVPSDTRPRSQ